MERRSENLAVENGGWNPSFKKKLIKNVSLKRRPEKTGTTKQVTCQGLRVGSRRPKPWGHFVRCL